MKILFRLLLGLLIIAGIYFTMLQMGAKKDAAPVQADLPLPPPKTVTDERVVLKAQGCSLKAPPGWEQTAEDDGGIMFIAPKEKYVANLLVVSLPFAESLDKFAGQQLARFKASNPDAVLGQTASFATEAGVAALKVVVQNKINDLDLAQMFYFAEGTGGQKLVLATNGPAAQRAELEPLFDLSVKSLVVITP